MLERGWQDQCAELRGETPEARPRYNLMVPRSACPSCGHKITAGGERPGALVARAARQVLAVRHGHLGALSDRRDCWAAFSRRARSGASARRGRASPHAPSCGRCSRSRFIDFDTQLLPDDLTLPLLWGGLLANLYGLFVPLREAVIGAIAGYLVLWTIYWLFKLIRGKEGMGYGDFKLLAALGAWLGWKMLPLIILGSSVVGALIGIGLVAFKGRDHNVPLAFGPVPCDCGHDRACSSASRSSGCTSPTSAVASDAASLA